MLQSAIAGGPAKQISAAFPAYGVGPDMSLTAVSSHGDDPAFMDDERAPATSVKVVYEAERVILA